MLAKRNQLIAIEVKSTAKRQRAAGLDAFERQFGVCKKLLVGGQGAPLEEFLLKPAEHWF